MNIERKIKHYEHLYYHKFANLDDLNLFYRAHTSRMSSIAIQNIEEIVLKSSKKENNSSRYFSLVNSTKHLRHDTHSYSFFQKTERRNTSQLLVRGQHCLMLKLYKGIP